MTRHENILSFDEARARDPRLSRRTPQPANSRRPAARQSAYPTQNPHTQRAVQYPAAYSQQASRHAAVPSQQTGRPVVRRQQPVRSAANPHQPQRLTYDPSFEQSFTATPRSGSLGSSYRSQASAQMPRVQSGRPAKVSSVGRSTQPPLHSGQSRPAQAYQAQAHATARPEPLREDVRQAEEAKSEKKSFTHRMRAAKAERQFNKRFGSDDPVKPGSEQSSRPALYEMKMGKNHKRSARMQNTSSTKKGSGFLSRIGRFLSVFDPRSPRFSSRALITCATFVLAVVMLYQPVANYYQEVRQQQQLEAEYAVVADYYSNLKSEVDYLNTKEGLEEYVREELGWVKGGERVATVEGLEPRDATVKQGSITADISNAVPTPVTWYSPVLDVLLGYDKP